MFVLTTVLAHGVIGTLAQETLQVTLALDVAALLDCNAVSNLLTNITNLDLS